jgi:organic radical activating enzyme
LALKTILMFFVTKEADFKRLLNDGHPLLKVNYASGAFIDAWIAEKKAPEWQQEPFLPNGNVHLNVTANGLFGNIEIDAPADATSIEQITQDAYLQIFESLALYPDYQVIRYWNFVPDIIRPTGEGVPVYQLFNAGRYRAFQAYYGDALMKMAVPAASAVGTKDQRLKIEFFAVRSAVAMIENKDQVPAYQYSPQYGKIPPFFSRGAIFDNNGQRLLLSSGTASIVGEQSLHMGDIYEQLCQSIHNLRILGSQFNLKKYNIHYGFALEDIAFLRVYYKREEDRAFLERFIPKFLAPCCQISFVHAHICREELLVELEAVFIKKGESESGVRPKYQLEGEVIRTESFELHIAEHCNLKCRDCCNISPFNAKKFMSLEEVAGICNFVNTQFRPDVFKIAGGEPTLHPQLDEILKIVKRSCPGTVVRVISNGLLLHRMSASFWENIDQLTISNYISAPVKPRLLEEIRQKARQYEIVLNIKFVEQFNEIFVDDVIEDKGRVQQIFNDCWMRHRCLIVRNRRFYKCTRAAYMDDFLGIKGKSANIGASSYSVQDGIALDDPDFRDKALNYLNDSKPLHSCHYCLGVSGNLRENIQLRISK